MKVPEGWKRVTLKEVARLYKGVTYKSEDYCGDAEGYIFINLKCIAKSGGFKREGIKYIKGKVLEFQRLSPDDLLIANTDLTRDGDIVGCPILVPKFDIRNEITMSMDLSKLDIHPERIDKLFLYYILMTPLARKFMKERSRGSTVLHLQTRLVPTFTFNIPIRVIEQSKIAEILSTVDDAIDKTEALIQKYQRIKQGLMQDLLTKGIDEEGNIRSEKTHKFKDSPLGRIPEEWDVRKVKDLFNLGRGRVISDEEIRKHPGVYPVFSSQTINEGEMGRIDTFDFEGEYITWTTDGAYAGTVFYRSGRFNCTNVCGTLRGKNENISHRFFAYLLSTKAKKYVSYVGNPKLMNNIMGSIELASPLDPSEQRRIASILIQIDEKLKSEQIYKQKLLAIKRGLMEDLLTGKVRVNHLLKNS
jgi:type I restriction enzyme S subunit